MWFLKNTIYIKNDNSLYMNTIYIKNDNSLYMKTTTMTYRISFTWSSLHGQPRGLSLSQIGVFN